MYEILNILTQKKKEKGKEIKDGVNEMVFNVNLSIKIYWSHCGHVKHGSWFLDCYFFCFFFYFLFLLHRSFTDFVGQKIHISWIKNKQDSILASGEGTSLLGRLHKTLDVLHWGASVQIGHGFGFTTTITRMPLQFIWLHAVPWT